jgi:hypothetical protein
MQPLPRLTADRLAVLASRHTPENGRAHRETCRSRVFTNAAGITQNMVDYVDSRGVPGSFEEKIFLSTATEHLNAVQCEHCFALRHPKDCVVRSITNYMTTRQAHFCDDKGAPRNISLNTRGARNLDGERNGKSERNAGAGHGDSRL